jgi:hypothetical protein
MRFVTKIINIIVEHKPTNGISHNFDLGYKNNNKKVNKL